MNTLSPIPTSSTETTQSGSDTFSLPDILNQGKEYLKPLVRRNYVINNGHVCLQKTKNTSKSRKVDIAYNDNDVKNTLDRELHVRIAALRDGTLSSQYSPLKEFERLLLRCAGDRSHRQYLKSTHQKVTDLGVDKLEKVNESIEKEAQEVYNGFVKNIGFNTSAEEAAFLGLSWEHRQNFEMYPFSCRCWLIQACIIDMIDLEKE